MKIAFLVSDAAAPCLFTSRFTAAKQRQHSTSTGKHLTLSADDNLNRRIELFSLICHLQGTISGLRNMAVEPDVCALTHPVETHQPPRFESEIHTTNHILVPGRGSGRRVEVEKERRHDYRHRR